MVIAYHFAHNDGVEWGTLEHPDESVALIDLYECDGEIRAFNDRAGAEAWLTSRTPACLPGLNDPDLPLSSQSPRPLPTLKVEVPPA